MNKTALIKRVSEISGVKAEECDKVLKAMEQALEENLSESKRPSEIFDKVYRIMSFIQQKENK